MLVSTDPKTVEVIGDGTSIGAADGKILAVVLHFTASPVAKGGVAVSVGGQW